MVSYAAGTRFLSIIGGTISSFYDWYADLPIASPQVFGDQTDVPESGGLVERQLPRRLGHQHPDHPHARRALHGRGPLPRAEGRRGLARLLRPHQVRRRLAGRTPRHRRRAGDGHGARHPHGVLPRPRGPVFPRVRRPPTPTCPSWSGCADRRRGGRRRQVPHRGRPRPRPAGRRTSRRRLGHRRRRPGGSQRLARVPLQRRRRRAVEPRARGHHPRAVAARPGRAEPVAVTLPRFDVGDTEGGSTMAAACPPSGSARTW